MVAVCSGVLLGTFVVGACGAVSGTWHRRIAIANAAGPTGLAALCMLRDIDRQPDGISGGELKVCALVRDESAAAACRQAVCGSLISEGNVCDLCSEQFPTLCTSTCLAGDGSTIADALDGYSTLLLLMDEIHPTLTTLDAIGAGDEQMVTVPPVLSQQTRRAVDETWRLIDAAAEAGVQHVILQSSLGASERGLTQLETARMGGAGHLSLRRRLEEHLKSYSVNSESQRSKQPPPRASTSRRAPLRHTILQAAPYASPLEIEERRMQERRARLQQSEDSSLCWAATELALTSPESLAHAAVQAALFTRPNTLQRRVTKTVCGC